MEETEGKEEEEGAEKSTKHIVERLRQEVMSKTKQYMEVGREGKEGRRGGGTKESERMERKDEHSDDEDGDEPGIADDEGAEE